MWQLYALASVFADASESVIDKIAIVAHKIDNSVATFYRVGLYFLCVTAIGLLVWPNEFHLFFHWTILLFVPIAVFNSFAYTFLIKRLEVTNLQALSYATPLLYLLIDIFVFATPFSLFQVAGIVLLVSGGLAFSLDGGTLRIKTELTPFVWAIFAFRVVYGAVQAYLFKYLHLAYGLDGSSYYASIWFVSAVVILLIVVLNGKFFLLFTKVARLFAVKTIASKAADAGSSVLWAQALGLATVSQVNAVGSFDPLITFGVVAFSQFVLKVRTNEKLDTVRFLWKAGATILLVVGGFFVS